MKIIDSRSILKKALKIEIGKQSIKDKLMPMPNKKFIKSLRNLEYHYNNGGLFHKLMFLYWYYRWYKCVCSSGISIPKNVCDIGLTIPHHGSIVVNSACRIGKNCMIQNNVNIGANGGQKIAPIIGNDVYIGPGAVIFGNISIADGCYIGANAVVNKSVLEKDSIILGVPGKVVRKEPIHWWEKNNLIR